MPVLSGPEAQTKSVGLEHQVPSWCSLAQSMQQAGRLDEAVAAYEVALQLAPDSPEPYLGWVEMLSRAGRPAEAESVCRKAITQLPNSPQFHRLLASLLCQRQQFAEAAESLQKVLELDPLSAEDHFRLGVCQSVSQSVPEAMESYRRALALNPAHANAHNNLGNLLHLAGDMDAAISCYKRAIQSFGDHSQALFNLATALEQQDLLEEAAVRFRKLLVSHTSPEILNGYGRTLQLLGDYSGAEKCYQTILKEPAPPQLERTARYNLALLELATGRWEQGWQNYESRNLPPASDRPRWDGSATDEKLLIWAEQGIGDTIQFARYLPFAGMSASNITALVRPSLLRLLKLNIGGVANWAPAGGPMPQHAFHSPLMSLPGLLEATPDNIPFEDGYLNADPALVARWAEILRPYPRPLIGIAWAGNPNNANDKRRSLPGALLPLLKGAPPLLSLQLAEAGSSVREAEREAGILPLPQLPADLAETAAILTQLDLTITVDSATGHLAGAMGLPVWMMLPYVSDWRWLLDREDTPWYRSMRLFRQPRRGDWGTVIDRVNRARRNF